MPFYSPALILTALKERKGAGGRDTAVGHFQMVAILGGEVKSSHQWESVIRRIFGWKTVPAD